VLVARLRAAGCVVVGKTNTPEFGWTAKTDNALFGTTRNPWNLDHTPGGSSGGTAAALAAGMVPLATGSDGGGSIRIPAACCGLSGMKTSMGRVPSGGPRPPRLAGAVGQGPDGPAHRGRRACARRGRRARADRPSLAAAARGLVAGRPRRPASPEQGDLGADARLCHRRCGGARHLRARPVRARVARHGGHRGRRRLRQGPDRELADPDRRLPAALPRRAGQPARCPRHRSGPGLPHGPRSAGHRPRGRRGTRRLPPGEPAPGRALRRGPHPVDPDVRGSGATARSRWPGPGERCRDPRTGWPSPTRST
jgi:hypothetical protein